MTRSVSIIIPVPPGSPTPAALAAIERLDYPRERIEVLVVEGWNPSAQRNHAVASARGDVLYFLDDDSEPDPLALRRAMECLDVAEVAGVGGPVLHREGSAFADAVGAAMSSVYGLGPYRFRFVPHGLIRRAGERELISANLAVRRELFAIEPGFDERLYCNEENEWMARLTARGVQLQYHPLMTCSRPARATLRAVAAQMFQYGRGRLRHLLIHPRSLDLMPFLPLGVLGALLLAVALRTVWAAVPALLYAQMCVYAAVFNGWMRGRGPRMVAWLLALFPTIHLSYAVGLVAGAVLWALGRGLPARPKACRLTLVRELGAEPQRRAAGA